MNMSPTLIEIITALGVLVTALGVLVTAVLSGIAAIIAAKIKTQTQETHQAVNSRMDEFKRLFESSFIARGKLEERQNMENRQKEDLLSTKEITKKEEKGDITHRDL